ncbi:MAG: hypothetical protein HC910_16975 [Spirulinaceae cyanobacterium SM2_1_0]|nr:hypothetical protein [Spirulinaceae cyanobacterium SM2_1_0]
MYQKPLIVKALSKPGFATRKLRRKVLHIFQDAQRQRQVATTPPPLVNEKEIRMVGLRRTGNHALIRWLKRQHAGRFRHLNDIPVYENPFRHEYEYWCDHYPEYPKEIERIRQESLGNFVPTECLVYNYEDHPLSKIVDSKFWAKHDMYFGRSQRIYDLIILRDPFNLLASRIRRGFLAIKSTQISFVDLWLEYAKEFLGETNYLQNEKICVNYNLWVDNIDYRRELAEKLAMNFTDAGIDEVSKRAGGSSFDGTEFTGQAAKMDVHGRWKKLIDDPAYRRLVSNDELFAYSEKIFGVLPGTEQLRI